ncbi:hypothetical protein GALL_414880 [mine drainage metagenome]|uniref:Uncharacterized protein n=1 Tax=mine drainage metagenome TaxID=410659 RepID=A0A1J5Q0M5_9ZZZZ
MHFIEKTLRKQGTNRTVNQTAGQCLKLTGSPFALEKAAWNLACCVRFFKVVNRQWKKILAGFTLGFGNHCGQNHRTVHVKHDRPTGLARDLASFHGDRVLTPLKGLGDFVEYRHKFLLNVESFAGDAGHLTQARNRQNRPRCHSRAIRARRLTRLWNDTASLGFCRLRSKKRLS